MGSDAEDCRMKGCPRSATRTMSFKRHDDVAVCERHYRRNVALKYLVIVGLAAVFAGLAYAVYLFVL